MQVGSIVRRQSLSLGFGDTFTVIGIVLAIAAISLFFARKLRPGAGAAAAH